VRLGLEVDDQYDRADAEAPTGKEQLKDV
jgi:hypothetical protein